MRILVVKTSSMGDVVHALPAASDIAAAIPGVEIDWMVEAPFAAIPALHPAIGRVLPMAWRKWRKRLLERETRQAIGAFRRALRETRYDLVLDLQGLLKSAIWALQAQGPTAGYDARSIREPAAALLYRRTAAVSRSLHAIERCRRLAAAHLGYPMPATPPRFGLQPPASPHVPAQPFAVLIPAASRPEKLWPESDWIALASRLRECGLRVLVFWGSAEEEARAQRIARAAGAEVPPFLSVRDAAGVLGRARLVVGLDTGFSHLAAAFGVPTVGIYCDHEPAAAGITGDGFTCSLGGIGQVPAAAAVDEAVDRALGLPCR